MLAGKWTYRSFRNDTDLVGGDASATLALISAEGVLDFEADGRNHFRGALGMASGHALTLEATTEAGATDDRPAFTIVGEGIDGTSTAGWRCAYRGNLGYLWPDAVDQVPCLVGTMIQAGAHGRDAAGSTAAFIAVKHLDEREKRPTRRSALTAGL